MLKDATDNDGRKAWKAYKEKHGQEGYDLYIKEVFNPEMKGERTSTGTVYNTPNASYGKDADLLAKFIKSAHLNTQKYDNSQVPYHKDPTAGSG